MIFSKPTTVKLFVPFFGDYKLSATTIEFSERKKKPQMNTDKHRWKAPEIQVFLLSMFIWVHLWFHFPFALRELNGPGSLHAPSA